MKTLNQLLELSNWQNIPHITEVSTTRSSSSSLPSEEKWLSCIPEEYRDISLEKSCNEIPKPLVDLAVKCVNSNPIMSLYFCGNWGSGKTTLAFALIRHLTKKLCPYGYFWPNFISAREFDARLLKSTKDGDPSYEIETWVKSDLLFIDDLDKISPTERFKSQFFEIINKRMVHKRPTIITCNSVPDQLCELLDGSVVSRMSDESKWQIIGFPKVDLRKIKIVQF